VTTGAKRSRDKQLLISAAETIGSTLGTIAARAEAAAKALGGRKLMRTAEHVTKALNRGKLGSRLGANGRAARKSRGTAARNRRTGARRVRRPARASAKRRT
jgi:hypothetical protein